MYSIKSALSVLLTGILLDFLKDLTAIMVRVPGNPSILPSYNPNVRMVSCTSMISSVRAAGEPRSGLGADLLMVSTGKSGASQGLATASKRRGLQGRNDTAIYNYQKISQRPWPLSQTEGLEWQVE